MLGKAGAGCSSTTSVLADTLSCRACPALHRPGTPLTLLSTPAAGDCCQSVSQYSGQAWLVLISSCQLNGQQQATCYPAAQSCCNAHGMQGLKQAAALPQDGSSSTAAFASHSSGKAHLWHC